MKADGLGTAVGHDGIDMRQAESEFAAPIVFKVMMRLAAFTMLMLPLCAYVCGVGDTFDDGISLAAADPVQDGGSLVHIARHPLVPSSGLI